MNYEEAKEVLYSGGKVTIFDEEYYKNNWYVDYDCITNKAMIHFENNISYDLRDIHVFGYYKKFKNSNNIKPCNYTTSFIIDIYENVSFEKAIDAMKKGKTIARNDKKYSLLKISNLEDDYISIFMTDDNYKESYVYRITDEYVPFSIEDMLADDWVIIK